MDVLEQETEGWHEHVPLKSQSILLQRLQHILLRLPPCRQRLHRRTDILFRLLQPPLPRIHHTFLSVLRYLGAQDLTCISPFTASPPSRSVPPRTCHGRTLALDKDIDKYGKIKPWQPMSVLRQYSQGRPSAAETRICRT